MQRICVPVIVRNNAILLERHLQSLESQHFPRADMSILFLTGDNSDHTIDVIDAWSEVNEYNYSSITILEKHYGNQHIPNHYWTAERYKQIGELRQVAWDFARAACCSHIFMVDSDIIYRPETLTDLLSRDVSIVAPLIDNIGAMRGYHNFSHIVKDDGYFIREQQRPVKSSWFQAEFICAAILAKTDLDITYDDGSARSEDVIFNEYLRRRDVPLWVDASRIYGYHCHFAKQLKEVPVFA